MSLKSSQPIFSAYLRMDKQAARHDNMRFLIQ